jgi:exodeoxyribonuclease VII small subunit
MPLSGGAQQLPGSVDNGVRVDMREGRKILHQGGHRWRYLREHIIDPPQRNALFLHVFASTSRMSKSDSPGAGRSQSDIFTPAGNLAGTGHTVSTEGPAPAGDAAPLIAERSAQQKPAEAVPVSFESALSELEALVAQMESGELTLEQSLSAYKRGATLLQFCQTALTEAQQQVKILEGGVLKDFSGANENGQ